MNINSTNSFSFCFHFSKRSSWPPILIATNDRRNEAEDCSRVERERRDGSRFTFAYQRPWKDGFREKCVATLRNSSYKGETYFSPDVWKAFDLAFPSLSLSLSSRRSSLSKGRISLSGSVYISKGTDSWRCRPSYLLLFSEQLVSSVDPTSQIDPCRDIRASGNAGRI